MVNPVGTETLMSMYSKSELVDIAKEVGAKRSGSKEDIAISITENASYSKMQMLIMGG